MPDAVSSGTLYQYADDTTVYCIGSTIDEACSLLNKALNELNECGIIERNSNSNNRTSVDVRNSQNV
ncbi:hypothetical protein ACROYT_G012957 [Oculina patagonica]